MEMLVEQINGEYRPILKIGLHKFSLSKMDTQGEIQFVADRLKEAINKNKE